MVYYLSQKLKPLGGREQYRIYFNDENEEWTITESVILVLRGKWEINRLFLMSGML